MNPVFGTYVLSNVPKKEKPKQKEEVVFFKM